MKSSSSSRTSDDRDEYPVVTQADLDRAAFRVGLGPVPRKQRITISLDTRIIDFFKSESGEARLSDLDQRDPASGDGTRRAGRRVAANPSRGAAPRAALRRRLNGTVPEAPARRRIRVRHGRRGRCRVTAAGSSRRCEEVPTRTDPSPRRSPAQGIHGLSTSITQMEIRRASSGASVPRNCSSSSAASRGRTPDSGSWQYSPPNQSTR